MSFGRPGSGRSSLNARLNRKIAIVTGARAGLGQASEQNWPHAARVVVPLREATTLPPAAAIGEAEDGREVASVDVTTRLSGMRGGRGCERRGRIDNLVTRGITRDQLLLRMKRDDWIR